MDEQNKKIVNTTEGPVNVVTPAAKAAEKKAVRVVEKAATPTSIFTDAPQKKEELKREIIPRSMKKEVRFVVVKAPLDAMNEKDTIIWFGLNGRIFHFRRGENVEMPEILYQNCIANSDLKDKVQIISRFTKEVKEKKKAK